MCGRLARGCRRKCGQLETRGYERNSRLSAVVGGSYANWDLEIRGGVLGAKRMLMATEDLIPSQTTYPSAILVGISAPGNCAYLPACRACASWELHGTRAWLPSLLLALSALGVALRAGWESRNRQLSRRARSDPILAFKKGLRKEGAINPHTERNSHAASRNNGPQSPSQTDRRGGLVVLTLNRTLKKR